MIKIFIIWFIETILIIFITNYKNNHSKIHSYEKIILKKKDMDLNIK
jgi:hypothetical protein